MSTETIEKPVATPAPSGSAAAAPAADATPQAGSDAAAKGTGTAAATSTTDTTTGKVRASVLDKTAGTFPDDWREKLAAVLDGSDESYEEPDSAATDGKAAAATDEAGKDKTAGTFPDDWREKLAAGNEKMLTRLKRYKSLADFTNAGLAAQDKIRSGELKAKLPEEPTAEELAAYRKENGIPEEPKAYEIPKVPGHQWTDADVPVLDGFKTAAHEANLTQPQVDKVIGYYANLIEQAKAHQAEKIAEIDNTDILATEEALRAKVGGEYRPRVELVRRLMSDREVFSESFAEALKTARTPDGRRLINNAEALEFFMDYSHNHYGDGALISGDAKQAMANTEEQARTIMKTDIKKYYAEGWDKKLAEIVAKKEGQGRGRSA